MKKLNKRFVSEEVSLAAYYTCMCNHLPCPCISRASDGPEFSATEETFHEMDEIENASWNN